MATKGVNCSDAYESGTFCRNSYGLRPPCAGSRNDTARHFSSAIEHDIAAIQHDAATVRHDAAAIEHGAAAVQHDTAAIKHDRPGVQQDGTAAGPKPAAPVFRHNRRIVSLHSRQLRQSKPRKRPPLTFLKDLPGVVYLK